MAFSELPHTSIAGDARYRERKGIKKRRFDTMRIFDGFGDLVSQRRFEERSALWGEAEWESWVQTGRCGRGPQGWGSNEWRSDWLCPSAPEVRDAEDMKYMRAGERRAALKIPKVRLASRLASVAGCGSVRVLVELCVSSDFGFFTDPYLVV